MKRQNREVNIFNMSLLDILCGALGAFCFMMLALFPSYMKAQNASASGDAGDAQARADAAEQRAKDAEDAAAKARADQSMVYTTIRWDTPDDVDLWVKMPSGDFYTVQKDATGPAKDPGAYIHDAQKGPAAETVWFPDVAYPNARWEIYAELHTPASPPRAAVPAPGLPQAGVPVRAFTMARSFDKTGNPIMGFYELGTVMLTKPRERVFVGRLAFDAAGQDFNAEGAPPPPAGGPKPSQ